MAIEELDDIAEELADRLGLYSEKRMAWVPEFKRRVRNAVNLENRLRAESSQPADRAREGKS